MKIGCDILIREEHVQVDRITGHGGLFKTKGVAQGILAAALNAPVTVMATAGEGGAWGIAVLADYEANKADGEKLDEFLDQKIFAGQQGSRWIRTRPMSKALRNSLNSTKQAFRLNRLRCKNLEIKGRLMKSVFISQLR